jgi:hypothetical protein
MAALPPRRSPTPSIADRLAELRGPVPPRHHDARTIAALTANPGCSRRAVLDAAGVDKRALAERIGFGPRFGQSPFAISRGNAFEKLVKADGGAALLDLLRDQLGLTVDAHVRERDDEPEDEPDGATDVPSDGEPDDSIGEYDHWIDLGEGDREQRYRRTRELVAAVARDPDAQVPLADHPLLKLDVGGRVAYVEPDLVAFRARTKHDTARGGESSPRWYLAEIKSFAVIDGRADPVKVAEAATQAAVYVLAFQALLADLGLPTGQVATDVVLICPKDFTNTPTAALVDVRRQLAAVRRQLDRLPRIGKLLETLDAGITFDLSQDTDGEPARGAGELGKAVATIEARYAPDCVSRCDMAFYCRDEARNAGCTDLLGRAVRDALGGVGSVRQALTLSESRSAYDDAYEEADADLAEAARLLSTARRARREALREAAGQVGEGRIHGMHEAGETADARVDASAHPHGAHQAGETADARVDAQARLGRARQAEAEAEVRRAVA